MQGGLRGTNKEKHTTEQGPLVSIITVTYNAERYLNQTIKSVLSQSYQNVEYIIIDGGSTDNTLSIIKQYEHQIDYWQSEPDKGIYDAMNKGINLAKGELIGILNADDFYFEHTVKYIVNAYQKLRADVYHGDMLCLSPDQTTETRLIPNIEHMRQKPSVFHPTCFVKKTVYEQIGVFDTRFKISSDYEFLLRCLHHHQVFYYIPELITAFRQGGMSSSCYSNVEGYRIMKRYRTGYQNAVIWRGITCYVKTFIKKIIHLK